MFMNKSSVKKYKMAEEREKLKILKINENKEKI